MTFNNMTFILVSVCSFFFLNMVVVCWRLLCFVVSYDIAFSPKDPTQGCLRGRTLCFAGSHHSWENGRGERTSRTFPFGFLWDIWCPRSSLIMVGGWSDICSLVLHRLQWLKVWKWYFNFLRQFIVSGWMIAEVCDGMPDLHLSHKVCSSLDLAQY